MTVSTTTSRVEHAGNGSTTAFAVPFYFLANADLKVYKAGVLQTITTHYTVSGAGNPAGGTVTFVSAPAAGQTVVILRDPALTQTTDYVANDPFPAESHERALDRLTMIAQRNRELGDRSFRLPDGDTSGASTVLPSPEANTVVSWNSQGTALVNRDPSDFATALTYADRRVETFTGDGVTVDFTLAETPAVVANTDVDIEGVSQVPGVDYQLLADGLTLRFDVAPPNGQTIAVKYGQAVAQGRDDAATVYYAPEGAGAVSVSVQTKLREFDFFVGHGGSNEPTNTRLGEDALADNTTGTNNTAVGKKAMELNTTGYQNTAVGVDSMFQNSTGHYNTAVGEGSMMENTTGTNNTAIGHSSYKFSTTGSYNTALGKAALHDGGSGSNNTAVGYAAMFYATTGARNTMVGNQAGQYTNTGNNNTFVGYNAGVANSSSTYNTFVGSNAGESIDTGTKNTVIGVFNGNQNGLDIRNANNHVVLADGDGNPRAWWNQDGLFRTPAGVCFGSLQALTASSTVNENAYYVLVYSASGTVTLTLIPRTGRVLKIVNQTSHLVQSASSNIAAIVNGALGTQILPGTAGKWVELWCDGTNWNIVAAN